MLLRAGGDVVIGVKLISGAPTTAKSANVACKRDCRLRIQIAKKMDLETIRLRIHRHLRMAHLTTNLGMATANQT